MNFAWALVAIFFLSGCTMDAAIKQTKIAVSSLGAGALTVSGQDYQLLQLNSDDSPATFVQWIPNSSGTKGPVVIYMMPYEGIDWTGLAVDLKWAPSTTGWHADVDGPYYNASTSANVFYQLTDPDNTYYATTAYSRNNISVLAIYSRYYAGADIKNSVQTVLDGISFLKDQSIVDTSKIAITGESWGAFAPLYAMAASDIKLAAASLLYPMTDAQDAYDFAFTTIPAEVTDPTALANFNAFFEPYLRRINKSSEEFASQSNRYRNYRHAKLAGLTTPLFIAHDEWDTSVPKTSSDALISLLPNTNSRHYFHLHNTALDFNTADLAFTQSSDPMSTEMTGLWAQLFIVSKLLDASASKTFVYDAPDFVSQFNRTLQAKAAALDTAFYQDLLKMLCDSNITMQEANSLVADATGPEVLLYLYQNEVGGAPWNTATSANICALIDANPLF